MSADLADREQNIRANFQKWDRRYPWPEHGDEWKGQAAACGVAYDEWKRSLIANLIAPYGGADRQILEIAPGHGRWTEALIAHARRVTLVDLSPACLAFCRERFAGVDLDAFVTDGMSLPPGCDGEFDLVWSFDSFVHMAPAVVDAYVKEIARVLKPGGTAVIHHADIVDLDGHDQNKHPGWRSALSAQLICDFAESAGLAVVSQFTYWDKERRIGVPGFGDKITILQKP